MKDKNPIKGKRILITGGTGSFGTTMMQALLDLSPEEIIIFSRDELKQYEMRNLYDSPLLKFVIGDVRDRESLDHALKGINLIFHAAALKQVPACEFFPMEAIKTNSLGGYNVIQSAIANGIERVVLLSTDKAVYPISAMGITKAIVEKIMSASAKDLTSFNSKTRLCAVRYGNVMYSRGSVIPYFVDLIKANKKPRVTHPHMTRFLLPLSFSVQLVLHALTDGENGSIYIKKAPASDLGTLAKALCRVFGVSEDLNVIGIRAAEKMHETLISKEEWIRTVDQGNFYRIPPETTNLDYDKYFNAGKKTSFEEKGYTSENTKRLSIEEVVELLLALPQIQEEVKNYKKR